MRSHRVDTIADYLSPTDGHWARVKPTRVALMPTPLGMQPTAYIRAAWAERQFGATPAVEAASVHDGTTWAIHLKWTSQPPKGPDEFPDALAVALPITRDAVLAIMGTQEAPIHFLRWDSRQPGARSVVAGGLGTSAPGPDVKQAAQAQANGAVWQVVLTRTLGTGARVAPLQAGATTGVGFAVWRGANDERAGIKAFSIDWTELSLDA